MNILLAVLLLAFPQFAWAYPENIRHSYQNCTTCHVSPNGGGVITEYGRELSKEIMSTWGRDGEQAFAYGLVTPPSWLLLGGDYRSVYFVEDSPGVQSGKWVFMQGDLEAAATFKQWTAVFTLGYQETPKSNRNPTFADSVILRRHYLLYAIDDQWSVRAGKFDRSFGVKNPEHVVATKRGLGFDQGTETYNIEASYITKDWNLYGTAIFGRPDVSTLNRETGAALSGGYALGETHKIGASYYNGSNKTATRNLFGPWAILGFTQDLYLLAEMDFVKTSPKAGGLDTWGLVNYERLGYEVYRGVIPFFAMEHQRTDFKTQSSFGESYSLGLQWLPRPHFDFTMQYQRQRLASGSYKDQFSEYGIFMSHFYF